MMDVKRLGRFNVKDADKGEIEAVFSTFNVIDHDRDVVLPAAFTDGPVRISAYNHGSSIGLIPPVGRGTIRTTSTEAILSGKFFMDVPEAAATFSIVKEMGELQEWSYHYHPEKFSFGMFNEQRVRFLEKLHVNEVSPVLVGASINTRTLAAKAAGKTFADEASEVLASVTALVNRAADVVARRSEKGKHLGAESAHLLQLTEDQLKRLAELLAPEPAGPDPDLQRELLRFLARNPRMES